MVLYELHFSWSNCMVLLIPLVVGLGFFFTFKWYPAQNPGIDQKGSQSYAGYVFAKWVGWIVGSFAMLLFLCSVTVYISEYCDMKQALADGNVLEVEGVVEQYHGMPLEGHDTEHFEINGVYFEYSNFEVTNGYHQPASYGGVIKENGQHLKIKYVEDDLGNRIILYIEELPA